MRTRSWTCQALYRHVTNSSTIQEQNGFLLHALNYWSGHCEKCMAQNPSTIPRLTVPLYFQPLWSTQSRVTDLKKVDVPFILLFRRVWVTEILHPTTIVLKIAVLSTGYLQVTQRLPAAAKRTKTKQRWSICDVAHGRLKILSLVSSFFFCSRRQ